MMATCRYSDVITPSPPASPSDKLHLGESAESVVDEFGYYMDKFDSEDEDDMGLSPDSLTEKSNRPGGKYVPHKYKPAHLVARRNARERRRVEAVNSAFIRLRKVVPYENRHKRLSKAKTLRTAINYIRQLQQMINHHDGVLQDQQTALGYQQPQHHLHPFSPEPYQPHPADQCAMGTVPTLRTDTRSYLAERCSQSDNLSNTMLHQFADHVFRHASHLRSYQPEEDSSNSSCLSPGNSYTESWVHQHTLQRMPMSWPDVHSPTEKTDCFTYHDIKPALFHPSQHYRAMPAYISS